MTVPTPSSQRRTGIILLFLVSSGGWSAVHGQRVADRVATGGTVGAILVGAFGAYVSNAICDASSCGDAWVDGAVPGLVLGGLAGAAAGAVVGLIAPRPDAASLGSRSPMSVVAGTALSRAKLSAQFRDQAVTGFRATLGIGRGGLSAGPALERLSGGGWTTTSVQVVGRLEETSGWGRRFAEVGIGQFGWEYPVAGGRTARDSYLGLGAGVGIQAALIDRLRLSATVHFHSSARRHDGDGSTSRRLVRQVGVGLTWALAEFRPG